MNNLILNENPIGADIKPTPQIIEKGKQLAVRFAKDKTFRKKVLNIAKKFTKNKSYNTSSVQSTEKLRIKQCVPKVEKDEQTGIEIPKIDKETIENQNKNKIIAKEGNTIKILDGADAGKTAIVTSVRGENKFTITELTQ